MTKIVICSVPFLEVVPPVAPALLSSCLNEAGIPSVGIDFNIDESNNVWTDDGDLVGVYDRKENKWLAKSEF